MVKRIVKEMWKQMRNRLLLVGLIGFIGASFACKKADNIEIPEEFPVDLLAERWEVKKETRLFTNNREVTDANVIRAYAERQGLEDWVEAPDNGLLGNSVGVKFASEDLAAFHSGNDPGTSFDVERKGNRFLFFSKSNYGVNPSATPTFEELGYLHTMLKYSDKLGTPGFGGVRQTREVRVGHGNYKVIKISAFAFAYKRQAGVPGGAAADTGAEQVDFPNSSLFERAGVFLNEFDPRVRQFLGPNDTLAVKEYAIICTLRK
jgi:hypothetical protein